MSHYLNLPALKKGGDNVVLTTTAVAGAIIDMCAPLAGTALAQACAHLVRKRMESASEILMEELRKGNMQCLSEEKNEAFVPMAYRFFESAQRGESIAVLKKLAKIMKNGLENNTKPNFYSKCCHALEGLDDCDLVVLDYYIKNIDQNDSMKALFDEVNKKLGDLPSIQGNLTGRGLLIAKSVMTFTGNAGSRLIYSPSQFAKQIAELSKSLDSDE